MAGGEYKDAVDVVKTGKIGSLGTVTKGQPFVSLTPYAMDEKGRPFVYLSDLAYHTKNLKKSSKGSLMVSKLDEKNIFNSARVSFVGKMTRVTDKDEVAALKKIFFAKFPDSKDFEKMHDFAFYRMEIEKIQYIGGFGDINWIKGEDWLKEYNK
jgi:putative heme iron utilization protein